MMRRFGIAMLVLLVLGSILAWPSLPERIPLHYGMDGSPDRWGTRNPLAWFTLPLVGVGVSLLFTWIRARARRDPSSLNLPGKERLLRLEEPARGRVVERILTLLSAVEVSTLFVLALIQVGTWATATGGSGRGWILSAVAVAMLGSPVILVGLLLGSQRALDRAETDST